MKGEPQFYYGDIAKESNRISRCFPELTLSQSEWRADRMGFPSLSELHAYTKRDTTGCRKQDRLATDGATLGLNRTAPLFAVCHSIQVTKITVWGCDIMWKAGHSTNLYTPPVRWVPRGVYNLGCTARILYGYERGPIIAVAF